MEAYTPGFDFKSAIKAGKTNADIDSYLGTAPGFDYVGAVAAGKGNEDIDSYLSTPPTQERIIPIEKPTEPFMEKSLQQAMDRNEATTVVEEPSTILDRVKQFGEQTKTEVTNIIPSVADLNIKRDISGKSQTRMEEAELQSKLEEGTPVLGQDPLGMETSFLDPINLVLENKVAEGAFRAFGWVYDVAKMGKNVRAVFGSKTPEEIDELANTFDMLEHFDIKLTDAFVEGSKGSDMVQYLSRENVFAARDAFQSQQKMQTKYLDMMEDIMGNLKAKKIDPKDITTWRDSKQAEAIITKEVQKLRQAYKDMEGEAYGEVSKLVDPIKDQHRVDEFTNQLRKNLADDGVPVEASNVVFNILNRMAKPFRDDTQKLAGLGKEKAALLVNAKKLKAQQRTALEAGDDTLAIKLEQKIAENSGKISENLANVRDLKDVKYMTPKEIMASIKLINRKIYKPGGSISIKDADELRGLQIAKHKLQGFLDDKITDPVTKEAIRTAKDITISRAAMFGAKDTGGEKLMMAKLLNDGDYGKVTEYLTGKNAKENLLYLRDTFGKDSTSYQSGLGMYLNNKLGFTPEGLTQIMKTDKIAGISNSVGMQEAAAKIKALDIQDFAMIKEAAGDKVAKDMKSMQSIMQNFAALESARDKLPRGLNYNVLEMAGKGMKVVKDAVSYQVGKTVSKVVFNQPKFRTLTGALTGETVYMATEEDISIEGALMALLGGGVLGYGAGRATRSVFESDVNKIARYLKNGNAKKFSKGMPKGIAESMARLGEQAKGIEEYATEVIQPKYNPGSISGLIEKGINNGNI